jgi:enterochelin esterase-like enzyme
MPCMVKRQENNVIASRRRRRGNLPFEMGIASSGFALLAMTAIFFLAGCAPKLPPPDPTAIPSTPTPNPTPTAEVVAVPSPTPEPCLDATGQVNTGTFASDFLPEYYIYFPKCYFADDSTHYPVLYLLHGQTYTAEQWLDLGVAEHAAALMDAGEIPPFLIVMPLDRLSWDLVENDPFGDVFIDEFIDHIDAEYRTLPEREFRALGGLSRGAGWTIRLGLQNWERFGALGIHSPAIFQRDASKLDDWLGEIPDDEMPLIFFDIGDRDTGLADALRFADLLAQEGIVHEWHLYNGWHDDAYWQAHVEEYLRWYGAVFDMGD